MVIVFGSKKAVLNSIVDGFKFLTNSQEYGSIIMQDTYNCLISNNKFLWR